jgi:hypothetical protein
MGLRGPEPKPESVRRGKRVYVSPAVHARLSAYQKAQGLPDQSEVVARLLDAVEAPTDVPRTFTRQQVEQALWDALGASGGQTVKKILAELDT